MSAAAFFGSATALEDAISNACPYSSGGPPAITLAPSACPCAMNGCQTTHASTCPEENAARPSAGARKLILTSSGLSPTRLSSFSSSPCAELPLATAIVLPFSCSGDVMSEPLGTSTPSSVWLRYCTVAIARKSDFAAAPKIGGVEPTPATSILSAPAASTSGGPNAKVENVTL